MAFGRVVEDNKCSLDLSLCAKIVRSRYGEPELQKKFPVSSTKLQFYALNTKFSPTVDITKCYYATQFFAPVLQPTEMQYLQISYAKSEAAKIAKRSRISSSTQGNPNRINILGEKKNWHK